MAENCAVAAKDLVIRVLCVEDNIVDADLLMELLELVPWPQFEVAHVEQLSEAAAYVAENPVDVILLDLSLPDAWGLETIERMQEHAPQVPIIVLTGNTDEDLTLNAVQAGAQDYLIKGEFDERLLVRAIRYAIDRMQARVALEAERASLARRVDERTAELSRANEELDRANRLKDEFLANMSHELRTPLNAVLGMADILLEDIYGPLNQRQHDLVETVRQSGQRLLRLVNDVLDMAKIGAGLLELDIWPVPVQEVCHLSLYAVREQAEDKNITLVSEVDPRARLVQADEYRLRQILVNLLDNGVKFTPAGGRVGLTVEPGAGQKAISFTVWDTGIGISEEQIPRLFKPFTQLDGSLSRSYEGTGLGLALVFSLTEAQGGSVSLESEPDKGSRFTVTLPMATAEGVLNLDRLAEEEKEESLPQRILVADDNVLMVQLWKRQLQAEGYQVFSAQDGLEVIQRVKEDHPQLVLIDIQMPRLNGLEAIRHLRMDPASKKLPIVAITALSLPGHRERCLQAGANHYLTKPVSAEELLATVRVALGAANPPSL